MSVFEKNISEQKKNLNRREKSKESLKKKKKNRGIMGIVEPVVQYSDVKTVMDHNPLVKKNKLTAPNIFSSFGIQIRKNLELEEKINKRYTACKGIDHDICRYNICVSELNIPKPSQPHTASTAPTACTPCVELHSPDPSPQISGGAAAVATADQKDYHKQLDEWNKLKKKLFSSRYNSVSIKVYTIFTELNVAENDFDPETRCWVKVLNMFLDEIYYQNAANDILKTMDDVRSPEVILSFCNLDESYLELYIISEWINVEDLKPEELLLNDINEMQQKVKNIDDFLQQKGIYHNDLYRTMKKNLWDETESPKIHPGNVKREIGTGNIVILDFGAAQDHKAAARGILKKKPKKSKKPRKSKKTRKSKKRKSKKRRKSKKTRKSKKRKSKKPRKSKKNVKQI